MFTQQTEIPQNKEMTLTQSVCSVGRILEGRRGHVGLVQGILVLPEPVLVLLHPGLVLLPVVQVVDGHDDEGGDDETDADEEEDAHAGAHYQGEGDGLAARGRGLPGVAHVPMDDEHVSSTLDRN